MLNKYIIGAILWAILILVLTLSPGSSMPDLDIFSYDKLGHAFIFFVFAFLLISGIYEQLEVRKRKAVYIGAIIAALYGFLIEVLQHFIPQRSMEIYDALANIIGSFFGLGLFYVRNIFKA